ncbi:DNA-directed RNA polymerase subunit omega [Cellulophaga sp. HaHaR_3_176]|uniref:DNA-directed RNA polymerase subunit omega n=1 Tax=Cellulophaga sp. HaHaR_3_176 TaxID=1942464 RepID=UPI001C2004E6|nr:DNA-directed RNA polymerase subunit omega [Cellulophaga sp. HaHaR_3_176]QWX82549.1 DNA-directed RNA polymerase subunit omega [Cellulophaga sp. HaHaR_3_176]
MNMNDLKNSKAPVSTVTINKNEFDAPTGNIYEAIAIASKRAVQINSEIKKELLEKLEEFATYSDSLEEVFENKEQIEVSKFYEKLPKPHALAVTEWLDDKIYHRNTAKDLE